MIYTEYYCVVCRRPLTGRTNALPFDADQIRRCCRSPPSGPCVCVDSELWNNYWHCLIAAIDNAFRDEIGK